MEGQQHMRRKTLVPLLVSVLVGLAGFSHATLAQNWKLDAPQTLKTATLTTMQLSANVVTATTAAPHGFVIDDQVYVYTDGSAVWDSIAPKYTAFTVTGVPSATTFTYNRTAGNVPATAVTGTASVYWLGLVFENRGMTYNDATGMCLWPVASASTIPPASISSILTARMSGK
jgi:hypothetical protein